MIKLTDEQACQIDQNIEAAMDDLRMAAFEGDDQTPLITTGTHIGMALQKLHDIRTFLIDQKAKEFTATLEELPDLREPDSVDERTAEAAAAYLRKTRRHI